MGFLINPVSADNINCTIHKLPDFFLLQNPGLRDHFYSVNHLRWCLHTWVTLGMSSCLVACGSVEVHIVILCLIGSHNRTGVKSQYLEHCPCHPHIHPRATNTTGAAHSIGAETHHTIWRWVCIMLWSVCV